MTLATENVAKTLLPREAIQLLKGEADVLGFDDGVPRDELIGRYSHILVDEYQDIDEVRYELIFLLAGRTLNEGDQKMTLLAVEDDDLLSPWSIIRTSKDKQNFLGRKSI